MISVAAVNIRQAVPTDLPGLRKLSIDSFVHAYASFNTEEDMQDYLTRNFSEEMLRQELNDPKIVFLLAEMNNELTGYVKLNRDAAAKCGAKKPVEIARLYTKTELIGKGIGKQILESVVVYACEHGHDAVCLDVWQKNFRAVNFYQREGFHICGLTQFTLGKDVQDDFVMIRWCQVVPPDTTAEIVLETQRLRLRKFIPEIDANYFVELLNSPGWLKYIGDRKVYTRQAAIDYINNRVMKHYVEFGYGSYVVVEKSSGKSIGNAGLFKRPHLDHPDIGYAFLPEFEGKGYAFEAASAVMQHAHHLNLKKIYAITVAYNERSIHLMNKLGLKFEKNFRMEGDPEELCLYVISLNQIDHGRE